MLACDVNTVVGACGVTLLHDFYNHPYEDEFNFTDGILPGGAGFITAGFIYENELSDNMFALLSSKYDVLFVSPVRLNRNSKNQFYFAVFSVKDVENDKYGWQDQDDAENEEND